MHGHQFGDSLSGRGALKRKAGRGKAVVATAVSAAVVLSVLSAAAVMRDNVWISAENAEKYTSGRDVVLQDTAVSLVDSAGRMQEWLEEMGETVENSMESIAGSGAFLSGLDERLSEMDSILSGIMDQADHVASAVTSVCSADSNGNTGSSMAENISAMTETLVSENNELRETVSVSQMELRELLSVVQGDDKKSFSDVYNRMEFLQEQVNNIADSDSGAGLSEINVIVSILQEDDDAGNRESLDNVIALQQGITASVQELLAISSDLVDNDILSVMSELDSAYDSITDTELSLKAVLSAVRKSDVSRMEEIQILFSSVKNSLEETDFRFQSSYAAVQHMVDEFKGSSDVHYAELASTLNVVNRNFLELMGRRHDEFTDTVNRFEHAMDTALVLMQENVDNSFADLDENVDIRFSDMNAVMDDMFLSTGNTMDTWFANTDVNIITKFASLNEDMVRQFVEETTNMDNSFADTGSIMNEQFAETNSALKTGHEQFGSKMDNLFASTQVNMDDVFNTVDGNMSAGFSGVDSSVTNVFLQTDTVFNGRLSSSVNDMDNRFSGVNTLVGNWNDQTDASLNDLVSYVGIQLDRVYADVSDGKQLVSSAVNHHAAGKDNHKYVSSGTDMFSDFASAVAGIGTCSNVVHSEQLVAGATAYNGNTGEYVEGVLKQSPVVSQTITPGHSVTIDRDSYFLNDAVLTSESILPIIQQVNARGASLPSDASISDVADAVKQLDLTVFGNVTYERHYCTSSCWGMVPCNASNWGHTGEWTDDGENNHATGRIRWWCNVCGYTTTYGGDNKYSPPNGGHCPNMVSGKICGRNDGEIISATITY